MKLSLVAALAALTLGTTASALAAPSTTTPRASSASPKVLDSSTKAAVGHEALTWANGNLEGRWKVAGVSEVQRDRDGKPGGRKTMKTEVNLVRTGTFGRVFGSKARASILVNPKNLAVDEESVATTPGSVLRTWNSSAVKKVRESKTVKNGLAGAGLVTSGYLIDKFHLSPETAAVMVTAVTASVASQKINRAKFSRQADAKVDEANRENERKLEAVVQATAEQVVQDRNAASGPSLEKSSAAKSSRAAARAHKQEVQKVAAELRAVAAEAVESGATE